MLVPKHAVQRVTITVTRGGEEPIPVVRYFYGYERLSLDLVLETASIDVTKHMLAVGDELVIAVDSVSPAPG